MGYLWEPDSVGGRDPFLCPADMEELKTMSKDLCREGSNFIELHEFLELVTSLKTSRILMASQFLRFIHCHKIATTFSDDFDLEPSRQWINTVIEKLDLSLESTQTIDEARWDSCSKNIIKNFYRTYRAVIEACPRPLLFGADETMLKSVMRGKVLSTKEHDALLRRDSDIPHISAMCCHNIMGEKLPPFIVLPNSLQSLPNELQEFVNTDQAWFASSSSGWMNADLFQVWCVHFINWLSVYRMRLPLTIRNKRALLVMDGHASRECPKALELLRRAGIDLLILPAHTTHITQMFDICLAAPLKKLFAKYMQKLLHDSAEVARPTMISK